MIVVYSTKSGLLLYSTSTTPAAPYEDKNPQPLCTMDPSSLSSLLFALGLNGRKSLGDDGDDGVSAKPANTDGDFQMKFTEQNSLVYIKEGGGIGVGVVVLDDNCDVTPPSESVDDTLSLLGSKFHSSILHQDDYRKLKSKQLSGVFLDAVLEMLVSEGEREGKGKGKGKEGFFPEALQQVFGGACVVDLRDLVRVVKRLEEEGGGEEEEDEVSDE